MSIDSYLASYIKTKKWITDLNVEFKISKAKHETSVNLG